MAGKRRIKKKVICCTQNVLLNKKYSAEVLSGVQTQSNEILCVSACIYCVLDFSLVLVEKSYVSSEKFQLGLTASNKCLSSKHCAILF